MHASQRFSNTFPNGFASLIASDDSRRHNAGGYELRADRLPLLNNALHRVSPDSPSVGLDHIATAARRVLERYPMGARPAFVDSRMKAMERLQRLAADEGWGADTDVRGRVEAVRAYLDNPDDLLPDHLPTIGLLDDALLVDLALQALQGELADYEDFCHFRRIAADFAKVEIAETALTRAQWQEALEQANLAHRAWGGSPRARFAPDPRASLFHIT